MAALQVTGLMWRFDLCGNVGGFEDVDQVRGRVQFYQQEEGGPRVQMLRQ